MKKRLGLIVSVLIMSQLAGCGSGNKADKTLVCMQRIDNEGETFLGYIEVDYNSESDDAVKGNYSYSYENLQKSEANNKILIDLINRKSVYEDLEGIEITLDAQDTSFGYAELWDYDKLDTEAAIEAEESQKSMSDNGVYKASKMRTVFQNQGYSCDMNGEKQKTKK